MNDWTIGYHDFGNPHDWGHQKFCFDVSNPAAQRVKIQGLADLRH